MIPNIFLVMKAASGKPKKTRVINRAFLIKAITKKQALSLVAWLCVAADIDIEEVALGIMDVHQQQATVPKGCSGMSVKGRVLHAAYTSCRVHDLEGTTQYAELGF